MPYEFWTNILAYKMKSWFKMYEAKHQNAVKVGICRLRDNDVTSVSSLITK